ncbi:MAG: hypothetical protein ACK55I_38890, partial [bacterium]
NMALLCEYTELHYDRNMLMESIEGNKPFVLRHVVLQRANAKNQNGRVYPKEILMREASVFKKNFVDQRRAVGELDHPESPVVNLKNACCNVVGLWSDGDDIRGDIEILTTPTGNIVRELIKNNIRLGVSSRGMGSVRQMGENTVEVQEDFSLICFDIVSNPSTIGAFINENTQASVVAPYNNIDKLIHDFLSEVK